jgi:uncharacterized phosphosugar-binding protein
MQTAQYYNEVLNLLEKIATTQQDAIDRAADMIAQSLGDGGMLHIFGSGHSAMIGKEITSRAGGLVPINLIPDPTKGMAERLEGLGKILLDKYAHKYGLNAGEVLIVVSTSGRNPVPIEVAMEAKDRGLFTIALTSVTYSRHFASRHTSGKRLFEVVDLVMDNCVPVGDALVEIDATGQRAGASSTITGAVLVNMLTLRVVEKILDQGNTPPILKSYNLDGSDEHNAVLYERYRGRLAYDY